MKLSKTVAVPVVAALLVLVAGAVVVTASSAPTANPEAAALAAATPTPAPPTGTFPKRDIDDTALADTLDSLVAKGTITAAQKTAILEAVVADRTARQAERKAARQQMQDFLADGQITQDELDKLPADSPLRQLAGVMDDGKITLDELRGMGKGMFGGRGGGHGMGKGMWGGPMGGGMPGWDDPDASPAPSAGTGG